MIDLDSFYVYLMLVDGKRCGWIHVSGSWIPRHFFGLFHIFFANLRCFWLTVNFFHIIFGYSLLDTADNTDILQAKDSNRAHIRGSGFPMPNLRRNCNIVMQFRSLYQY